MTEVQEHNGDTAALTREQYEALLGHPSGYVVESPITGHPVTMAEAQREIERHRQRIVHVRARTEVRRTPVGKPGKAAMARRKRTRKQAKASRRRNR